MSSPPTQSLLLTLPREIRDQIYEYLFVQPNEVRALCRESDRYYEERTFYQAQEGTSYETLSEKDFDLRINSSTTIREGLGLVCACKMTAHEATYTIYSRNIFWLYDAKYSNITKWLVGIGYKNRQCLRHLRIDYAYAEPLPSTSCYKTGRDWFGRSPQNIMSKAHMLDALCTPCWKSTLRMLYRVRLLVRFFRQDHNLSRFELVIPDVKLSPTEKVLAWDNMSWRDCRCRPPVIGSGYRDLQTGLTTIAKTSGYGSIVDLSQLNSIVRGIGLNDMIKLGHTESKLSADQAQAEGWEFVFWNDAVFNPDIP